MRPHSCWSLLIRTFNHCQVLLVIYMTHLPLLHQKCLNPVVVALLIDPVGDGHRLVGNLEPLAEGPSEVLQLGPGESPQGGVELLDRLGIEGLLAGVGRG